MTEVEAYKDTQSGEKKKLPVKEAIKVTVSEEQKQGNEIRCRGECCS